ncbi:MAG TPA: glycosyltransferase family A protein [Thermoleophilaceae bacterium]|nr:glycosyltransferase family A protein [Thermoleophilaceae bacterium]
MTAPVDVIIPVYGESPFLGQALDGALDQEPAPARVIVVDNGSPEPLRLEGRHAERCTLLRRATRAGPAKGRAHGLEHSDAPLVALLDSDDVWEPGKLAAQLEAFERHPGAGLCFGAATVVDEHDRETGEEFAQVEPGLHDAADIGRMLFRRNPITTSSTLMRRTTLDAAGGFDHPATDDLGCWMRLAETGAPIVFEPRARIRYRRHEAGYSRDVRVGARLALAALDAHGGMLDDGERRELRRDWLTLMARGEFRAREWARGRRALREAAAEAPLAPRERLLGVVAAVPVVRSALGRRDPHA